MLAFVFASRKANVSNHADQTTPWNQRMKASRPYFIQFTKESVISIDMAQLSFSCVIVFQIPVGRGSDDKMDAFGNKKIAVSCVLSIKIVCCRKPLQLGFNGGNDLCVLCDSGKIGLMIGYLTYFLGQEIREIKQGR